MAYHLTGLYPEWWSGHRYEGTNGKFIAVGITLQSTAKILQEKLFGTEDVRNHLMIGTGAIPRNHIDFNNMEKDGARIVSCSIKHISGGENKIFFFCAGDEKKIMG